jgi:hypothetical protein
MSGPRPDLVAAWAVALGIFLILVASATSKGATPGAPAGPQGAQPDSGGAALSPVPGAGARTPTADAALRDFERELGLPQAGAVSVATRRQVLARMDAERATWYGPGLYGRRTACGLRLRLSTLGVAHRTLPCGTPVVFYYRGGFETVPVIDRGPYARGVRWDLTAAAARRLGLAQTARVRVAHAAP